MKATASFLYEGLIEAAFIFFHDIRETHIQINCWVVCPTLMFVSVKSECGTEAGV